MKLILTLLLLFLSLKSPTVQCGSYLRCDLSITESSRIDPYEAIWTAICEVESNTTSVINTKEQAYGIAQIRQIRLDDYYNRTGIRYSLVDMLDSIKSREVFYYYANKNKDTEQIVRRWNGDPNSKQTLKYFNKVKYLLNT